MTVLEQLFADYNNDIRSYLFSLCRDASLSEDLSSEVFQEVVKSIAGFRAESNVKTWLFSIARHRWYKYLQKKKRTIETEELENLVEERPPNYRSAEDTFLNRELVKRIYELIFESADGEYDFSLPKSILQPDALYDISALASEGGLLTVYVDAEEKTPERAAEVLLELDSLMKRGGVSFYAVDLALTSESGGDYLGGNFHRADIYKDGLVERVRENHRMSN